jgi:FlaA1/EpsC-like NDP-sugar epimerase
MEVAILGSGETALTAKRAIERDAGAKYRVVAFFENDKKKIGKKIQGVRILGKSELFNHIQEGKLRLLILAVPEIKPDTKSALIDACLEKGIKVMNVPPVRRWLNGELSFKQIKKVNVSDLLEREIIDIHRETIEKELMGKRVLVTGAAGSIGSEIVRQALQFKPAQLILLDQAESPLYELERELRDVYQYSGFEVVVGDIRNKARMLNVFTTFRPEYIFHAAAYKHVPLMESNPSEALLTNVKGTKILADLSVEFNALKFVMVSTDKAVKPTNVMGASKRIAEIYVQALNRISATKFITTRFGNVLGSNGSVIPILAKQIERGGPVTVTHPEITRYFMTIEEACLLVLEAGAYGEGGEILLFDMGKSVRIKDLVEKMIKLSGLSLGKDISIVYTGLRPGEKLYEELLNDQENTVKTHHSRIMKALVQEFNFQEVSEQISDMIPFFEAQDNREIVKRMKKLVPEYKSQNSEFEALD